MRKAAITAFFMGMALFAFGAGSSEARSDEPKVQERVIKIEGALERPRIIYIVPRSKLKKEGIEGKSFVTEILSPVYPEHLINPESQNPKGGNQ